jgi:hypothetical protein
LTFNGNCVALAGLFVIFAPYLFLALIVNTGVTMPRRGGIAFDAMWRGVRKLRIEQSDCAHFNTVCCL